MKKILLLFSLATLVACRGNVGGHHHHEDEHGHDHGSVEEIVIEPAKAEKLGIETVVAKKSNFSGIIRTSGIIANEATGSWDIVANCSGKVIFLKEIITCGSEVGKSEALFEVKSGGMNIHNSASDLEKSKAAFEHAEKEYERCVRLRKERLATESELLAAKREYQVAETEYKKLSSTVGKKLVSPTKGFITSVSVKNGQYVEEGMTIATVSTGKDIVVEAQLPARYSSEVGNIVGANFSSGFGGEMYTADELTTSSDIVGEHGTFIPVRFKAKKSEGVTIGMPVEVYIKVSGGKEVITLPKKAVSERFGKYFVYERLDEDCYAEREVTIGECDGIDIEIKEGIKEGDNIVSDGVYYVKMAGNATSIPHGHSH